MAFPSPATHPSVSLRTYVRSERSTQLLAPDSYLVRNIPYTRTRARVLVSC
jgi:hypothetical protein